ncbi:hypothetical protein [Mycobacterium paragordonae]|uniref:Uncharacterized protein n=1 Tax=Mycobacterium paragordonae TaxID=1389713 RepID=A0AAJ1S8T9_9MYCO|nr:hypothetical protein [Mycobacterium paragordonae]MDP7739320.1 hypothetical protein [Mycobacterium paragordonae]TDK94621.1 hypothetical protein EI067_18400 [Mycobacterium paragordonae]TDL04087.1 hypothetical protein EUA05_22860 [Mycobacterium paragordonae]
MFSSRRIRSPLRSVVAIAAILWLLIGGTAQFEHTAPATPDTAHAVLTSFTGAAVVNGDPMHLKQFPLPQCPKAFAAGILPPLAPALIALGMLAALIAVASRSGEHTPASGRSPPRRHIPAHHGRALLTSLCVARR